jgi:hypothetical protein
MSNLLFKLFFSFFRKTKLLDFLKLYQQVSKVSREVIFYKFLFTSQKMKEIKKQFFFRTRCYDISENLKPMVNYLEPS